MTPTLRKRLTYAPWLVLAIPGIYQLWLLIYTVGSRVLYPYDLEWMEGGLLTHAARISDGLGIYVEPSADFIPYLYTPLYPGLVAALGSVFGITYALGRIISLLSIAGILALATYAIVVDADKRDRGLAWLGAVMAAGFIAATYPWLEGWYDLVRADSLFLAMVIGGLVGVRRWARAGEGWSGHARIGAAAALLGLSFFCKQTGFLFVATGGFVLLALNWRRLPIYIAVAGVIGLGGTALLNRTTGGWFWTYAFEVHQAHDFHMPRFWKSFENIFDQFPMMTAVIFAALSCVVTTSVIDRKLPRSASGLLMWSFVFGVSCVVGAVGWGTQWAHFNAYMPAMVTGAIACGAALPALAGCVDSWRGRPSFLPRGVAFVAAAAMAAQLVASRWNPHEWIPRDADRAAGDRLIAHLASIEGDIYAPYHPWYGKLAGKRTWVHRMGVADVTYGNKWKVARLSEMMRARYWSAILLDSRPPRQEVPGLRAFYIADILPVGAEPRVYTGAGRRFGAGPILVPRSLWVPKDRVRVVFDFQTSYGNWKRTGTAWGRAPVAGPLRQFKQGRVSGSHYKFADSMHGGDKATGTLESPPFSIDGKRLSFRISGGADPEALRVELIVDGSVVHAASSPENDESMRKITWDVTALAGKQATIRLVDEATGSWGHLSVDEIWLWKR